MPMQRQSSFPSQVSEAYSCGCIFHKVERGAVSICIFSKVTTSECVRLEPWIIYTVNSLMLHGCVDVIAKNVPVHCLSCCAIM